VDGRQVVIGISIFARLTALPVQGGGIDARLQ